MAKPEELLTLQSLSQHLHIPYARAIELRAKGVLKPEFTAKHFALFRKSRVAELTKELTPEIKSAR